MISDHKKQLVLVRWEMPFAIGMRLWTVTSPLAMSDLVGYDLQGVSSQSSSSESESIEASDDEGGAGGRAGE